MKREKRGGRGVHYPIIILLTYRATSEEKKREGEKKMRRRVIFSPIFSRQSPLAEVNAAGREKKKKKREKREKGRRKASIFATTSPHFNG